MCHPNIWCTFDVYRCHEEIQIDSLSAAPLLILQNVVYRGHRYQLLGSICVQIQLKNRPNE
jgi:hypothetical protein